MPDWIFIVIVVLLFLAIFRLGMAYNKASEDEHTEFKTDKLNTALGREVERDESVPVTAAHPHVVETDPGVHRP